MNVDTSTRSCAHCHPWQMFSAAWLSPTHCHVCAYVSAQVHDDITLLEGVLTPRESEAAGLLAVGPSNQDLAQALDVTERTARKYVSSVSRKLSMSRYRVGLLAFATHVQQCPNRMVSDSAT